MDRFVRVSESDWPMFCASGFWMGWIFVMAFIYAAMCAHSVWTGKGSWSTMLLVAVLFAAQGHEAWMLRKIGNTATVVTSEAGK